MLDKVDTQLKMMMNTLDQFVTRTFSELIW
jgi:hypothetical protein